MNPSWKRAIAARIDLVAAERGLDDSEIGLVKECDDALIDFAIHHNLNLDWLIYGDLRGRVSMACGYSRFGCDISDSKNLRENKKRIERLLQLTE
jgi:hypothetical protein